MRLNLINYFHPLRQLMYAFCVKTHNHNKETETRVGNIIRELPESNQVRKLNLYDYVFIEADSNKYYLGK